MIANKKLLNGRFLPVNGQFYNFVISYVAFSVIFCITFYSKNHGTKYYKQGKIDFFHGVEEIYYQTYKVYEGFIQGGIVK